ncbi:MHYT domain-containing protein [Bacillus sp. SL00103]
MADRWCLDRGNGNMVDAFIGMMAFHVRAGITYETPLLILSILASFVGSLIAFTQHSRATLHKAVKPLVQSPWAPAIFVACIILEWINGQCLYQLS